MLDTTRRCCVGWQRLGRDVVTVLAAPGMNTPTCNEDTADGTYSHVETEDQIAEAFGEALGGLLSTTHQMPGTALKRTGLVHVAAT